MKSYILTPEELAYDFPEKLQKVTSQESFILLLEDFFPISFPPVSTALELYITEQEAEKNHFLTPPRTRFLSYRARGRNGDYYDYFKVVRGKDKESGGTTLIHCSPTNKLLIDAIREGVGRMKELGDYQVKGIPSGCYRYIKTEGKGAGETILFLGKEKTPLFEDLRKALSVDFWSVEALEKAHAFFNVQAILRKWWTKRRKPSPCEILGKIHFDWEFNKNQRITPISLAPQNNS